MASLSDKLRRERELRGISLKQISEDTKIGVRFLEALEDGAVERIPGEFYRRSYLRAYARYLGLDEERALNAYSYSLVESENGSSSEETETRDDTAWVRWGLAVLVVALAGYLLLSRQSDSRVPAAESSRRSGVGASGRTPAPEPEPRASVSTPPAQAPGESSSMSEPSPLAFTAETSASEPGGDELAVVLSIEEACWLEVMADGDVVVSGLKDRGFRSEFRARDEVRLWLGNAGGVRLWINGNAMRPLGESGQVRKDLTITKTNYREFVSASGGTL